MKGLTDSEQSLELALDLLNGTFNRPDQKQVVHHMIFFLYFFILDRSIYVLCFEGILCSEMVPLGIFWSHRSILYQKNMLFLGLCTLCMASVCLNNLIGATYH